MISLILCSFFCGILSGMGIGGGSIFILISTIFGIFEHKEAQAYNLIMFIAVGVATTIFNLKNKKIDKDLLKKLLLPTCIGSVIGIIIVKNIDDNILKKCFYVFMVIIGIYEIISSLKNIISTKNNSK